MTELFLLPTAEARRLDAAFCREHFPARTARAAHFRYPEDRLRCLGAGALLAGVLGVREAELREGAWGKPEAPSCAQRFNLSHSGAYIVLAVSDAEVGVDVERVQERRLRVAGRVLLPEEREWMEHNPIERFFCLWTLKESVMKAVGKGLALPPSGFSVLPLTRGEPIRTEAGTLFGRSTPLDGYWLSVCAAEPLGEPPLHRVTAHELMNKRESEARQ
ncbi:MAG: 4'-phosphopantetheinyl transferase superfamily protein [Candidatus Faecousia sp.]|uniref:4'-phosphopantetheinyl transferase family protein n=1 Tax=Faecousia sp. TaxID=2952921 RepID=UPI002A885DA9|nr:4'-phosphopantetheinyl transferase superfamily protein [Candidatus Faecousia sp.]